MEHDLNILMIFGIKEKSIILTHTMYCCYCYDIPMLLMTAFVLQGHIYTIRDKKKRREEKRREEKRREAHIKHI